MGWEGRARTLNQRLKRDSGKLCYGLTDASYADGVLAVAKFTPQESEQSFDALAGGLIFCVSPSLTTNGFGKKSKRPSEAARYARNRGLRVWFLLPIRCQKLPIF